MARRPRPRLTLPTLDSELPGLAVAPAAPETIRGRRIALSIVLILSFLTVAWIASPLWVAIALGTVMAFTAQSTYRRLVQRFNQKRGLAAGVVTLFTGVVTAAVGALSLYLLTRELLLLVNFFQRKLMSGSVDELLGERTARLLERMGVDRTQLIARIRHDLLAASDYAATAAGIVLQTTTGAVLGLVIALITMYYVLLEWSNIAVKLERVLPLDPRHTRALVIEFRDVGRSSFVATVATALIQGVLAGFGYGLAGVPQPVTWALLTAIASFLPLVGTTLVWVPIAAFLALKGSLVKGILMAGWGVVGVTGLADYVIRPRLVGSQGHGHPLLMLVALLGGIEVLGLAGLIVAPICMSLFLAIFRIYERETKGLAHEELTGRTP